MITSGSVGGYKIYGRTEMTNELVAEAMKRSADKYNEVVVTEELLKQGPCGLFVWNRKRHIAVWNWADEHHDIVRALIASWGKNEEWLKTLRTKRSVPDWLMRAAFPPERYGKWIELPNGDRYYDTYFYAPKPNKYGIPWGKIENHEHDYEGNYGTSARHHADEPFLREVGEESGYVAGEIAVNDAGEFVRDENGKPVFRPFFERLVQLYRYDREFPDDPAKNHEIFLYWIKDVRGKLNEEGTPGETEAPEILPLISMNRRNLYPTHAHGWMIFLNKLISEKLVPNDELEGYHAALKHFQHDFGPNTMLQREPAIALPEVDLPEELWDAFTKQNKIVPLKKN